MDFFFCWFSQYRTQTETGKANTSMKNEIKYCIYV